MNKIPFLLVVTLVALSSGCAAAQTPPELNAGAFKAHFADEEKCSAFIEGLVSPAAMDMASLRSVNDMRLWVASHPKDPFANLVTEVQSATKKYGALHPEQESDQIKVTKSLYAKLKMLSGFSGSGCGPDVREAVMDTLYNGIGGAHSFIVAELEKNNIKEPSEQRWVLLTAMMAGKLSARWTTL